MSKNQKRVPELRFKGFNDDWELCKLKLLVDRLKSYSLSRSVEKHEYTGYKYIHYGDIHTKIASIIDESSNLPNIEPRNYELLQKGDVVLADASEDYQGIAMPALVSIDVPYKLVSGLHTIALRPNHVNSLFLYYIFHSPTFRKFGYKIGTGMKVFGISVTNLLKFTGMFPLLEEQAKIGNFLKEMDDAIDLHQRKLELLKQMKQGFLQKMFPEKGEIVPKLRFTAFDGEWEQSKVGNFLSESRIPGSNGSIAQKLTVKLWGKGVVPKKEKHLGSASTNYFIRKSGQFIYGKLDFLHQAFGIIPKTLNDYESTLDSPAFDISYKMNSHFFLEYISRKQFYLYQGTIANGSRKAKRIHVDTFLEMPLNVPNECEQNKIGSFLKKIDQAIALHQTKLQKIQNLKKAFLQKMFI